MSRQANLPTPERMQVIALHNAAVEAGGHRPGSPYIEQVYVSHLGPTATWLWQRLARLATASPSTIIDMADLASSFGLGSHLGPNSAMSRTLNRLVLFDGARRAGNTLAVRLALPDLPANRLARLPVSVRVAHQHLSGSHQAVQSSSSHDAARIAEGVAL
jgi:hypothetical protein